MNQVGITAVNRTDFQQLADLRIAEAAALLSLGKWDGAYYLAGYAVECALKACVAKLFRSDHFPEKAFSDKCYTHDLEKLIALAELGPRREAAMRADPELFVNWGVVAAWKESSRYERITEAEARNLYGAITDAAHGVLPWINLHW